MAESGFPGPCIIGYGSSRAAAAQDRCRWCDRARGPRLPEGGERRRDQAGHGAGTKPIRRTPGNLTAETDFDVQREY
jgi:hypothetical protein